jgi:hypothetical protein
MLLSDGGCHRLKKVFLEELSEQQFRRMLAPHEENPYRAQEALQAHLDELSDALVEWSQLEIPIKPLAALDRNVRYGADGWIRYVRLGIEYNPDAREIRFGGQLKSVNDVEHRVLKYMLNASADGRRLIKQAAIAEAAQIGRLRDVQRSSKLLTQLVVHVRHGYYQLADPNDIAQ